MSGGVTAIIYNGGESASASMSGLNCYRSENISESVTAFGKEVRRCIRRCGSGVTISSANSTRTVGMTND